MNAVIVSKKDTVTNFASFLPKLEEKRGIVKRRTLTTAEEIDQATKAAELEGFAAGFKEGYEAGRLKGREDGHREGLKESAAARAIEMQKLGAGLEEFLSHVHAALPEWYRASEESMTEMAMSIVRQVLASELQINRASVVDIVRESLHEVTHATHARIRVNPFDTAILVPYRAQLLAAVGSLKDIEIVEDPSITGGCVIETDGGMIDATVETKLKLIEGSLEEAA